VYFIKNTIKDHIIDSGTSFHANYCKEDLERFNLCSSKIRLADDMTLDIASVGDVVLETSFGTSWTLKDVRNKSGSLYMVKVHPEVIGAIIDFSGSASLWFREAEESFFYNVSEDKETAKVKHLKFDNGGEYSSLPIKFCVKNGIMMLKMVPETPLQFGVAERLSRTFRVESTGIHVEVLKILWADSVSTTCLIYCICYVPIRLHIPEEEWRVAQMKCDTAFGIRGVTRLSEAEILHLWTRFIKTENDSIVTEHGLSSEITKSLGGSSDTSERSENSRSFEDSERSDEEYS
ncbi:retrovirus-related pol polyprotein from transposon TNT 1-94, partial [Tanacetum coccineum]